MKILVVEDDRAIAQTLQLLLSSYNYAVDIAADGETGKQMAEAFEYDLILLDVILPKLDGISLCQNLRAKGFQRPILLLTGQGGAQPGGMLRGTGCVNALNAGADDYVVKPFDTAELIARVQALLRRGSPTNPPVLTWGHLSVDPSSRRVAYGTHLLSVTPKEYAILELFLRNPQKILSAAAILDHVWSSVESTGEEAVRVHIKELRQKLITVSAPKDFIKTIHRVGYQLNPRYSNFLAAQVEQQPTAPQIAELRRINEELRRALEELQAIEEELRQQNEQLASAQQTLKGERQRYQDLFEFAPDAYLVTDTRGVIQEANRASLQLFQVELQWLIGKPLIPFISEADRRDFRCRLANLSFVQNWEVNIKARGGNLIPVLIAVTQMKNLQNEVVGWRWSLRDIRSRKQMEQQLKAAYDELEIRVAERTAELLAANQALQQSEEKFRHFADNSQTVIWIARSNSLDNLYVSPAYEKLWGRSIQSLIDQPTSWLEAIHPDDRAAVQAKTEQQRQGETSYAEYRIVRPDGSVRWIWDQGFVIRNEAGQIYRYGGIAEDITDRKQAEIELCQRQEFLHSIFDGAEQGIFVIEVTEANDFRYSHFNRVAERLAGTSTQALEGKTPEEAFGATIGATFRQNYHRCLQTGKGVSYEEYVVFENHTIWTLTTLAPLHDQQGKIYRIVGTATDISARKQLELSLQASEAKLSRILDSPILAIFSFYVYSDRNWEYEYWSAGCERLFGYPLKNYSDKYFWLSQVLPADQEQSLMSRFDDFFAERDATVEYRFRRSDGAIRWFSSSYTARKISEDCWSVTTVNHDITDRKLAEQKIREQADLLNIASDAIFVRDLNHHILYWNQGAERLYGWSAAEALGQKVNELLQENTNQATEILHILLAQEEWQGEIRKVAKTGREVVVEGRWTLVRDEAGQPKSILCVNTNVTEKKQLEVQFYRAQRLESLGTLASGIAHDLNNVLTPILAIAQLLQLKRSNLDARSQEMLQVLEDSAKHGANMIKQILTFTRGTEGERRPVQVALLMQEVIKVVQQTFPKSIVIRENIADHSPSLVSADSTYLQQVLMNLCVNARDAMADGGILSLSLEHRFLDQAFAQTMLDAQVGNYVVITIADTGTGIPLEVRDRIFDPFFTTKAPGQGSGLGLATVLGIVKNYGGFLQVFSEVESGTEMKVYLPAIEATLPNANQPENPFNGCGEMVLIVDDDVAVQLSTQSLLESYHYTVLATNDGVEAIALYAQHQDEIRLVILDVMMPNMSGISLIQRLKAVNPIVKIIAMSGLPMNREPALAAGANAFLPKPYTLENLLENLQALL